MLVGFLTTTEISILFGIYLTQRGYNTKVLDQLIDVINSFINYNS